MLNIKVKLKLEVASAYIALHSLTIFFLWIGLGKNVFAYNYGFLISYILSVQFSSVAQSCLTLCDPRDCSMPGFPIHHQLPEPTQTHVHCISDAIQPSHPLSSTPPPTFNPSLFKWVGSSHQVAKLSASTSVLPMNIQDWFPLGLTGLISLQSKGLSRVFSSTVESINSLVLSLFMVQLSHPYMTTGKTTALTI